MPPFNPPPFEPSRRDSFTSSLWHATAIPAAGSHALSGDQVADVAVVGAGYTGLCAAIELARCGADVAVLDAREPGFGASGRNGGQVIPAFKYDPDGIAAVYGDEAGERVLDMVSRTADAVFDLVDEFGIACDPIRTGWIQCAHGAAGRAAVQARHRQWRRRGAPVELLEADALRRMTGTDFYPLGVLFRNAGTVQPLSYARGLARAAAGLGVRIFSEALAQRIEPAGRGWRVPAGQGGVTARQVVIAVNGYGTSGLWPGLCESVVPLYSMQIATDPLPGTLREAVMPEVQALADTRRLVCYCRKTRDHRFVIGSRGPFAARPEAADARALAAAACRMYPVLRGTGFPYRWAGRVAMTVDHIPHLHQLAPGVFAALGYNGRGVGMATMMGRILAAACRGARRGELPYPVSDLRRIPMHGLHRLGVHALVMAYRMLDWRPG